VFLVPYLQLWEVRARTTAELLCSSFLQKESKAHQKSRRRRRRARTATTANNYLRDPEMHISSHRTMTMVCPARSSLATMLHRRPSRWSRPSMTFTFVSTMMDRTFYNMLATLMLLLSFLNLKETMVPTLERRKQTTTNNNIPCLSLRCLASLLACLFASRWKATTKNETRFE